MSFYNEICMFLLFGVPALLLYDQLVLELQEQVKLNRRGGWGLRRQPLRLRPRSGSLSGASQRPVQGTQQSQWASPTSHADSKDRRHGNLPFATGPDRRCLAKSFEHAIRQCMSDPWIWVTHYQFTLDLLRLRSAIRTLWCHSYCT